MKKIYFLHGYRTSGKKFLCIKNFYKDSAEFLPICWDWDEYMNVPEFLDEKKKILKEDFGEKILMADSMGANLAWNLLNEFPNLYYVMTNPVFCAEQIREQEKILPEMRSKIFSATAETIKNKNIRLVISKFDEILDPYHYKKIFGASIKVLELEDEHKIINMKEHMPLIHKLIADVFEKSKGICL
ncbi:MAG: hypothetical protein LBQ84_06590 [Flavobacteriaceae bacterium]|jgi:predicted esterase YcpF (UPF0227 family)|nr:hypothetical protein [Flavobacteriaceae bacterium]